MAKFSNVLPQIVKAALLVSEGWLVGSTPINILADQKTTDYDILVPDRERYQIVVKFLSTHSQPTVNSCGGLKFIISGEKIDIWCEELDHYISSGAIVEYMYKFKGNILIHKDHYTHG